MPFSFGLSRHPCGCADGPKPRDNDPHCRRCSGSIGPCDCGRDRSKPKPEIVVRVYDYKTGDYVRVATEADFEAAKNPDRYTGVFADPENGSGRFLRGCAFDDEKYDFSKSE